MSNKKFIRRIAIIGGLGILIVVSVFAYLFFTPHRNIQKTKADYQLLAQDLADEYLDAYKASNEKYLDSEGESKVLEVSGSIASITKDFNDQTVILLKDKTGLAGVSCTFSPENNNAIASLEKGQQISVKGVIRSGAVYDNDLELFEHVIMEKCNLIKTKL